jgi:glycerol-3-phosphate O-acyltransferase
MSDRPITGLFAPRPRGLVLQELTTRARRRLDALPDGALDAMLEDALFHERKRLERATPGEGELDRLDALTSALVRGDRHARTDAGLALVSAWADEIHGTFNRKAFDFAQRVFPPALAALLTANPERLQRGNLRIEHRVEVHGDLPLLRKLAEEAVIVLVPTHVSNLDSPLIALALALAGLPPFQYGAGLNLFSNPVMAWWMRRLGAYTVDRTKRAALYKDVLKDYSVYQLRHRHHGLFFPGGTRSRSGALESSLKKGLLGTGLLAWQENLAAGRPDPDVYVVPLTLSFSMTLEAATLIDDFLADVGRQRYIISDDEFSRPRTVLQFLRRVLALDSAVVCRFGAPLDVLGHEVPADPLARREASRRRREYVCDRHGVVQADSQRDRVYTDRLADAIVAAYPRQATILSTHLAAWAGWRSLEVSLGTTDPFRIVRSAPGRRAIPRAVLVERLGRGLARVRAGAAQGRWHHALPERAEEVLDDALRRFAGYHRTNALVARGIDVVVEDPKLALYYRNRVAFAGLDVED